MRVMAMILSKLDEVEKTEQHQANRVCGRHVPCVGTIASQHHASLPSNWLRLTSNGER